MSCFQVDVPPPYILAVVTERLSVCFYLYSSVFLSIYLFLPVLHYLSTFLFIILCLYFFLSQSLFLCFLSFLLYILISTLCICVYISMFLSFFINLSINSRILIFQPLFFMYAHVMFPSRCFTTIHSSSPAHTHARSTCSCLRVAPAHPSRALHY